MLKNAIAYILRKRNRTIIVFIILTVVLSCLYSCLNITKSTNNLEKNQKEYEKRLIKIDEDITLKKIEFEQMQNNNSNKKIWFSRCI